jgi:uncharacterized membrane protein
MSRETRITEELSMLRTAFPLVIAIVGSLIAWLLNRPGDWQHPLYTAVALGFIGVMIGLWGLMVRRAYPWLAALNVEDGAHRD